MRIKRSILIFLSVFFAYCSSAQLAGELMRSRILILLDGSSSMTQKWPSGRVKFSAAKELIRRLEDSVYAINDQVQFGLRVFGHQSTVPEHNCYDTRNEVAFSTDNRSQMSLRLDDINPLGITPIAFALQEAADKDILDEEHNAYSIILITDGGESCGGDICAVMKKLMKSKVFFKPYIISLEDDPTLKTTYSCMGDFLQVTKDNEIPTAVKTIIDAFRPILKIRRIDYNEMQTITASAPSVLKVNVPFQKKPVADKLLSISESGLRFLNTDVPATTPRTIIPGIKVPVVKTENLDPPATVVVLPPARLKLFSNTARTININTIQGPSELPKVKVDTPRTDNLTRLKPAPLSRFNILFAMDERTKPLRTPPPLPAVKVEEQKIIPNADKNPKHEAKVEVTDDVETTVEVYFTNGAGKFYTTTPQVVLINPSTKEEVKKFYRTIDPSGNPDPQTSVPPGTYDLTFTDKRNFVVNNVKVEYKKKNKIYVTVTSVTLSFAYDAVLGKPGSGSRPVNEFVAIVTERNKAHGRVQEQKGTETMKYEPGNYHIEINTFPLTIRNIDLDFDQESVIHIPQPGFAKFTSDGSARNVTLWNRNGDRFVRFYPIDMNSPQSKHLQLQPGEYQIHYQIGPGQSGAAEKVKLFRIKPTEETETILD